MKSRTVHPRRTGDNTMNYRLRIEDVPSLPDTHEAHKRQQAILRTLAEQPSLLNCGPAPFQKLRMHHNGTAWIIEAEADVYTPQS